MLLKAVAFPITRLTGNLECESQPGSPTCLTFLYPPPHYWGKGHGYHCQEDPVLCLRSYTSKTVKPFPSHAQLCTHNAALISVTVALSWTPAYAVRHGY